MKRLELKQMEELIASSSGFLAGLTCGIAIIAGAAIIAGTEGLAAGVALNIGAAGCGAIIGHGSKTGDWW